MLKSKGSESPQSIQKHVSYKSRGNYFLKGREIENGALLRRSSTSRIRGSLMMIVEVECYGTRCLCYTCVCVCVCARACVCVCNRLLRPMTVR